MKFTYPMGATPLDFDAKHDLIPPLTTQLQLNAFEQTNISAAMAWAIKSRKLKKDLVSIDGIILLHSKMFSETWRWAGKVRRKELNIGVKWTIVPEQVKLLCDDVIFWEENSVYGSIEIAVRFHHRLVQIHPFVNGNGRTGRLVADLFLQYRKLPALTWGRQANLIKESPDRMKYIDALRKADKGDYSYLISFAKG